MTVGTVTTFISEALARSQCFRKGNATCGPCHDPHPPNAAQNPNSLKFGEDADAMCVQCHTAMKDRTRGTQPAQKQTTFLTPG